MTIHWQTSCKSTYNKICDEKREESEEGRGGKGRREREGDRETSDPVVSQCCSVPGWRGHVHPLPWPSDSGACNTRFTVH